tara:strand:- start:2287 stop:2460 length:174 start_codon:yes stop_codon:yes gene_type:complete
MEKLEPGDVVRFKHQENKSGSFTYGGTDSYGKAIIYWFYQGEVKKTTVEKEVLKKVE